MLELKLLASATTNTATMSTFKSIDKGKQREGLFKDSTLILVSHWTIWSCALIMATYVQKLKQGQFQQPIVSLANVSQLASDLLVHSLQMQLVGRLTSKFHIPVVSPRDYVEGQSPPPGLSTPVEGESYTCLLMTSMTDPNYFSDDSLPECGRLDNISTAKVACHKSMLLF